MSAPDLLARLSAHPRADLAVLPTPLQYAPRFSEAIGREVWVKRDDLTGLVFGGNKARKLEYLLGSAAAGSADCVVSVGAPQSNHARSVAAAARVLGWQCHLVLGGDRPARPSGNLALDVALGAELHFAGADEWPELERQAVALTSELAREGLRPFAIPMGGSTAVGALGFVAAYAELLGQCDHLGIDAEAIVHATSTGGTQAGLQFASSVLGAGPSVIGVGVAKTATDLNEDVARLQRELAVLLQAPEDFASQATVLDGYLGKAYAEPTVGGQAAFDLLARTEAILTDPVYSAKALHAVIDLAHGAPGGKPLIFWHTGGQPALFSDSVGITAWTTAPALQERRSP